MMHRFSQYAYAYRPVSGQPTRRTVVLSPADKHRADVRVVSKSRREKNKALGRCINHPLTSRGPAHEPPVAPHVRCAACIEKHKRTQ